MKSKTSKPIDKVSNWFYLFSQCVVVNCLNCSLLSAFGDFAELFSQELSPKKNADEKESFPNDTWSPPRQLSNSLLLPAPASSSSVEEQPATASSQVKSRRVTAGTVAASSNASKTTFSTNNDNEYTQTASGRSVRKVNYDDEASKKEQTKAKTRTNKRPSSMATVKAAATGLALLAGVAAATAAATKTKKKVITMSWGHSLM